MANVLDTANQLRDAVFAIETELGRKPRSIYGNVKTRLDVIENRINNLSGLNKSTLVGAGDAGSSFDCYINESSNGLSFEDNSVYKLTLNILISNLTNPIKKAFIRKEVLLSKESGVISYTSTETLSIIGSTGWSASVVDSSNELFIRIASDIDDDRQAYVECDIQKLSF